MLYKTSIKSGGGIKLKRFVSIMMYLIPAIFLTSCYFLMTVTGEDILQGAGGKGNFLMGAADAFRYNARLSDMYAWAVIRIFDFQYKFGADTFVRIADVFMGLGIIYMIVYTALGRVAQLKIKDATVFLLVFCAIFLNDKCESLYLAFSHIHNYLVIGFFSMLFFVPFAMYLQGKEMTDTPLYKLYSLVIGFLFGFSSNITPVAFVLTFVVMLYLGRYFLGQRKLRGKELFWSWQSFSVYGIIIASLIMYVFGRGISAYMNESYMWMTDYISFADIFREPKVYVAGIFNHIFENFREMMPCILPMTAATAFEAALFKKKVDNTTKPHYVMFSAGCLIFVVMHTLVMSQILVSSAVRLIMPAYFVCLGSLCFSGIRAIRIIGCSKMFVCTLCVILIFISVVMIFDMGMSKYEYSARIERVIEKIDSTDGTVYIPSSENIYRESVLFGFKQYEFLQDWVLGITDINGKTVVIDYSR